MSQLGKVVFLLELVLEIHIKNYAKVFKKIQQIEQSISKTWRKNHFGELISLIDCARHNVDR